MKTVLDSLRRVAPTALLVLLALTDPPDPLWVAGIYDAADMDVLLHAVTALEGADTGDPPVVTRPSRSTRVFACSTTSFGLVPAATVAYVAAVSGYSTLP